MIINDPTIPNWSIILAELFATLCFLYGTYLILSTLWRNDGKQITEEKEKTEVDIQKDL